MERVRVGVQTGAALALTLTMAGGANAQEVLEQRLRLDEFNWPQSQLNEAGSAMVQGQQVIFVVGDGKSKGLFSIVFKVPRNTKIEPHSHPEERSCFVLSGTWYFAYGTVWDESKLKPCL